MDPGAAHSTPPSCATPLAATRPTAMSALNVLWVVTHLACELVRVEIIPPGVDLAVPDFECPHHRESERRVGQFEDVEPLRHHNRTVGRDIDDAEVDTLDARRAG